jgi:hypothetical protein
MKKETRQDKQRSIQARGKGKRCITYMHNRHENGKWRMMARESKYSEEVEGNQE